MLEQNNKIRIKHPKIEITGPHFLALFYHQMAVVYNMFPILTGFRVILRG